MFRSTSVASAAVFALVTILGSGGGASVLAARGPAKHVVAEPEALAVAATALAEGRPAEALAATVAGAGTAATVLPDLVAFTRGEALMALGRYREAAAAFQTVVQDSSSPWRPMAASLRADALYAAGQHRQALAAYEALVRGYREPPSLPRAHERIASLAQKLGQRQREVQALDEIAWRWPYTPEGRAAAERLQALAERRVRPRARSFDEHMARVTEAVRERRYDMVIESLKAAEALAGGDETRLLAVRNGQVDLWLRQGDFAAVVGELEGDVGPAPRESPDLARKLSRALRRLGASTRGWPSRGCSLRSAERTRSATRPRCGRKAA
jgi:tetratricopeptide (TPR) repeat protein